MADAAVLITMFSEVEAWQAVRHMSVGSAPGLDRVGLGFYKAAWNTVKPTVMEFLQAFHSGIVELHATD